MDLVSRFWSKVDRTDTCWTWTAVRSPQGYGQFWHRGTMCFAHRVSWELEHGAWPGEAHVLHSCDNPPCVRPLHLRLGTAAENAVDRTSRHRAATGLRNGRAKLSDGDVREMRHAANAGADKFQLAAQFKCHPTYVAAILRGDRRKENPCLG